MTCDDVTHVNGLRNAANTALVMQCSRPRRPQNPNVRDTATYERSRATAPSATPPRRAACATMRPRAARNEFVGARAHACALAQLRATQG